MTGHYVIGALLAGLVESPQWLKFRWDFDERACSRAWRLSSLAIVLAGAIIFLEGNPYYALPNLLVWMPPLLLPMQFVQSFGTADSLPLNTFSFLAHRRRLRNLRLGLKESVVRVNFGNLYFVTILVASTLGQKSNTLWFLPGIVILTGWRLLAASGSRPTSLVVALLISGGIAIAGQMGLQELNQRLRGGRSQGSGGFDPNQVFTQIGRPGKLNLSTDIVWRLRVAAGQRVPRLLRTGTYNSYRLGRWNRNPGPQTGEDPQPDFEDLDSKLFEGEPYFLLAAGDDPVAELRAFRKELPRFSIRGGASEETPLPLPGDATSLRDFELDGIEKNSFGTVRVYPKHSIIEGTVLWNGDTRTEAPPIVGLDSRFQQLRDARGRLIVPNEERQLLREIIVRLDLESLPTLADKLAAIRRYFARNFRYSLTPEIVSANRTTDVPTAISKFLTTQREGHCEYFATATILLLREAGIPARYATGYAVAERDAARNEFVIRGTHGHAWCRVWNEAAENWIDFDTTPPLWLGRVDELKPRTQALEDALKRLREDFFLWRNQPRNRLGASIVMSAIGLGAGAFVIRRLWRSKRRLAEQRASGGYTGEAIRTPLHELEPQVRKHLGPRPAGLPFARWLERLQPALPAENPLAEAIRLHQRLRFDPAPPSPAQQERLAALAAELRALLRGK